jgi:hypothetical protein
MTSIRDDYEQFLLKEIRGIPESELPKIIKMIQLLKEEILQEERVRGEDLDLFWKSFGGWQDERSPEEIIREIRESRKPGE